jgi:hypothetical protein
MGRPLRGSLFGNHFFGKHVGSLFFQISAFFSFSKKSKSFYLNLNLFLINNLKFRFFILILFCFIILFFFNDNIINCMADNSDSISDNSNSKNTMKLGISINIDEIFKYVGYAGLLTGAGVGSATILNKIPSQSRLKLVTIIGSIIGASYITTTIFSDISNRRVIRNVSNEMPKIKFPEIEFDGVIKFNDYSINAIIKNNEFILSDLKHIKNNTVIPELSNINSEDSNVIVRELVRKYENAKYPENIENTVNSASIPSDDYCTISDSYNIPSILENGDILNIVNNNPYLKLEFVLLFVLFLCLSSLFSLTVVILLKNYSKNLNNYFTNKYILMYINLNKKYLEILTWAWFAILYVIIV